MPEFCPLETGRAVRECHSTWLHTATIGARVFCSMLSRSYGVSVGWLANEQESDSTRQEHTRTWILGSSYPDKL